MASASSTATEAPAPPADGAIEGDGGRSRREAPILLSVVALAGLLLLTVVVATGVGAVGIARSNVLSTVVHHLGLGSGPDAAGPVDGIVWNLRLPRILMAALCGMGLAGVGVVMQGVTRNPLADPYLLGLSSGASLGAVTVVALGLGAVGSPALTLGAFIGATVAFALVLVLASGDGRLPPVRTILAGVAIGEAMAAATSFVTISSTNAQATRSLLVWLLGGFAGTSWADLPLVAALVLAFAIASRGD
ncbi:MAG TPA: iron ABC transporter permease, partial [Acidimicrobiales bacterium]|nr:iron ABC transporter permease [Acidimicrobiales bacterium]